MPGSDKEPLFHGAGAGRLADRWLHVFGCDPGDDFRARIAGHDPSVLVTYGGSLHPEWSFQEVPSAADPAFRELVSEVSARLAAGERDPGALRRAVDDRIAAVLPNLGGVAQLGVRLFCESLARLRVTPGASAAPR